MILGTFLNCILPFKLSDEMRNADIQKKHQTIFLQLTQEYLMQTLGKQKKYEIFNDIFTITFQNRSTL